MSQCKCGRENYMAEMELLVDERDKLIDILTIIQYYIPETSPARKKIDTALEDYA